MPFRGMTMNFLKMEENATKPVVNIDAYKSHVFSVEIHENHTNSGKYGLTA